MLPAFLLPESKVREAGVSPELDLGEVHEDNLLLTLGITHIVEKESLELSIWGSADGQDWGSKPLLAIPKKFYCGTYQIMLNLTPRLRYLRAKWQVKRWGRADLKPLFEFYVLAQGFRPKAMVSGA